MHARNAPSFIKSSSWRGSSGTDGREKITSSKTALKRELEFIIDNSSLKQREVIAKIRDLHSSTSRGRQRRGRSGRRRPQPVKAPQFSFFNVYSSAVHLLAQRDDLRLCEELLSTLPDKTLKQIVNAPIGRAGYTPLTRAVFLGSERMIKFLTSAGGDLNYINSHGESMLDALNQGEKHMIEKKPQDAIFTKERFRVCREYIKKITKVPVTPSTVVPRVPRRVLAARKISEWAKERYESRRK